MITASIVTYETDEQQLLRLLRCILLSNIDVLYIIDNSKNNVLNKFENLSNRINYVFGHGNIGYGAAHNIAIRKASIIGSRYHIVINPDIYFDEGVLEKLTEYMDNNISIGQIMPRVIYPNGELQYLCKLLPAPFDLIGRRFFSNSLSFIKTRNDRFELKGSGYDKVLNVPYLSGCFMFLRISSVKEIGLFDENIFMYGEDIDYSRRMHGKFKTIFYPYVTIVHAHMQESYRSRKMLLIHIKSIIYYFNKWGWLFDSERKLVNNKVVNEINSINNGN